MLLVAMIYGLTSVMGKAALDYMPASSFGAFYFVLVGTVSVAVLLLRRPASGRALLRRPGLQLLAGGLFAVMIYTHYLALETAQASYMIAVKRTSILFSVLYGSLFFDERNLWKCLMAAAVTLVGVAMLARDGTAP
jgi:drug/metabolite transporter (DMT)-like permease